MDEEKYKIKIKKDSLTAKIDKKNVSVESKQVETELENAKSNVCLDIDWREKEGN